MLRDCTQIDFDDRQAITEHFAQYFSKAEPKQLATLLSRLPGVVR
jgi:hypothetical protein